MLDPLTFTQKLLEPKLPLFGGLLYNLLYTGINFDIQITDE